MRKNHVLEKLRAGQPSVGMWLSLPSPEAAEYVSRLGVDWLVVDAEHSAVDIRTLALMFMAINGSPAAPMVRIPWNTAETFKRVLDAGAWGVVVPMLKSRQEAEDAVSSLRYPPVGVRSVGGGRHAISFDTTASEYYEHANEEILLAVQIEHIDGVERADDILSVPGIDVCFVGPNDLAASMGVGLGAGLECDDPRVVEAIDHVLQTCRRHGVAPGIHCSNADAVNMRIEQGFLFCGMASELRYMLNGISTDIRKIRLEVPSQPASHGPQVQY